MGSAGTALRSACWPRGRWRSTRRSWRTWARCLLLPCAADCLPVTAPCAEGRAERQRRPARPRPARPHAARRQVARATPPHVPGAWRRRHCAFSKHLAQAATWTLIVFLPPALAPASFVRLLFGFFSRNLCHGQSGGQYSGEHFSSLSRDGRRAPRRFFSAFVVHFSERGDLGSSCWCSATSCLRVI